MTETKVISSRIRNLGFGWETQPEQTEHGLTIKAVTAPDVTGSLRQCEAAAERMRRVVSGGAYYDTAVFVGGKPVVNYDVPSNLDTPEPRHWFPGNGNLLAELREYGKVRVTLA